jgi:hypothetical protein
MKQFKNKITLSKNSRGCWIIDTVKGCSYCKDHQLGCYNNCYAQKIASRYMIDFSNPTARQFDYDEKQYQLFDFFDSKHVNEITKQIKSIDMPFVRIGEMGDPSEDWGHTLNVCGIIQESKKPVVIITKHWNKLEDSMLKSIRMLDLYMNTSISAMDTDEQIKHRMGQYEKLKKYCNSCLRIVSCDFNTETKEGSRMKKIQDILFKNDNVIDTVFRPDKTNDLVINGIIHTIEVGFLRTKMLASMNNKNAYLGFCNECPDMCGLTL